MKTSKFLMAVSALLISATSYATILNINNSTPSPGEYITVADALGAASAGDSLYFAPTNITYGNLDIDKELHLFGPGADVVGGVLGSRAILTNVLFSNIAASNSTMQGLQVTNIDLNDTASANLLFENMVFQRNMVYGDVTVSDDLNNSVFEGNIFFGANGNNINGDLNACSFQNNIFNGYVSNIDGSIIQNNIFLGPDGGSLTLLSSVVNSNVVNNIFLGRFINSFGTNTAQGNIAFGGVNNIYLPAGNLTSADPLFVSAPLGYFSFANDYQLQASSPLLGAGAGGNDLGVFGGDGIFRADLEPSLPIIRVVNVPGGNTVPANSSFTITIDAEAHE